MTKKIAGKHTKLILLMYSILITIKLFSQNIDKGLIKTIENINGIKRRELFYDSSFNLIEEHYFSKNNTNLIVEIKYDKNNSYKSVIGYKNSKNKIIIFSYYDSNGVGRYYDKEEDINLSWNENGFNGVQRNKNIIVNYLNDKLDGKYIQLNNIVNDDKNNIGIQRDENYLKKNMEKFYNKFINGDSIGKYDGIVLNFKNGKINGSQKAQYQNGKDKFILEYNNGRLIKYISYSKDGEMISLIQTKDGISDRNQLLNGTIMPKDKNYIFWNESFESCGKINIKNTGNNKLETLGENVFKVENEIKNTDAIKFVLENEKLDLVQIKQLFDKEKYMFDDAYAMKYILGIPNYFINKYTENQNDIISMVPLIIDTKKENNGMLLPQLDTILFNQNYYYPYFNYTFYKDKLENFNLFPDEFSIDNYKSEIDYKSEMRFKNSSILNYLENNYKIPIPIITFQYDYGSYFPIYNKEEESKFLSEFIEKMIYNLKVYKTTKSFDSDESEKSIYSYPYSKFETFELPVKINNLLDNSYIKIINQYQAEIFDGNKKYIFHWGVRGYKEYLFVEYVQVLDF